VGHVALQGCVLIVQRRYPKLQLLHQGCVIGDEFACTPKKELAEIEEWTAVNIAHPRLIHIEQEKNGPHL
jgi:hypothetical protein